MTVGSDSKPPPYHVMIVAGEPSGDLHGANLVRSLLEIDSSLLITGLGGDLMEAQGMDLFFHIKNLSVMGVTEVIAQFRVINRAFRRFRQMVKITRPDLVILIDYPGFNLRAAAFARRAGVPVLYYITPKVWAWKRSRLKTIQRVVDHAALIFPFEVPLFQRAGVPATFVGHPLLDCYPEVRVQRNSSPEAGFVIGLLPGSRETEISTLLDPMLQAALLIRKKDENVKFLVSLAGSVDHGRIIGTIDFYNAKFPDTPPLFVPVKGPCQVLFDQCDILIAASGTVTLEAAICGVPMIIVYRLSKLSYLIARTFVRLKHVGLANIIAKEEIVPELLQDDATPEKIALKVLSLLNRESLDRIHKRLMMIRKLLGGQGASRRTARLAMELLRDRSLPGSRK
ncbi:MAG: lipid-A-disaccharide synthase [Desulfobacterium sp.]|nr:lipid-A-disaccharide synthase [Desulfobacterium sp.]